MFTLFVYIITKELGMLFKTKKHAWVNKDYCKQKDKIADMISKAEVDASIEKNEKVAYCRCWKSKTVCLVQMYNISISLFIANFF